MNTKWIYIIIAIVGCLLMISGWASAGFSFTNLFADKAVYTEVNKTETIGANDTIEIKTDVESINIGLSNDEFVHMRYFDSDKKTHSYSYEGGVMSLSVFNDNRKWYDYINFSFALSEKVIELQLPASFNGKLRVSEATGKVRVENVANLDQIDLSLTTGDLSVSNCGADETRLATTTGRLDVSSLRANTLTAQTTTGDASYNGLTVTEFSSRFSTGRVAIANADCAAIDVRGTTGSISIDNIIASDITLRSSTGSISGSIASSADEFTVDSSTSTGQNNLKNFSGAGLRKLSVVTSTGNINITFAG